MYCEQCGQELDDDARFCTSCGASISVSGDGAGAAVGDGAGAGNGTGAGDAIIQAEQPVQAESASAQAEPENKPVSFSTVMNETKARTKRLMPIPILIALVIALSVSAAAASYYVYVSVIEPMINETTQQSVDETNDDENNTESNIEAEAKAAYANILDEYRRFAEYVANGGSIDDLEKDEADRWTEYPDVATVNSSYYSPGEEIHYQYAYKDFDEDGIPELLMGSRSSIGDSISLFQMFTYQNGESKELFQSDLQNRGEFIDENPYYDLTTNGYIKSLQGTGGHDDGIATYKVYTLESGELKETASFAYEINNGNASGFLTIWENGDEKSVTVDQAYLLNSEFEETYPWPGSETVSIDDSSLADWQDL